MINTTVCVEGERIEALRLQFIQRVKYLLFVVGDEEKIPEAIRKSLAENIGEMLVQLSPEEFYITLEIDKRRAFECINAAHMEASN